jgi:peptide deformylase
MLKKGMDILVSPAPFLRTSITNALTFPLDPQVEETIYKTANTLRGDLGFLTGRALGLSSSQVGVNYRYFVCYFWDEKRKFHKLNYILNPRILKSSCEVNESDELCLSVPGNEYLVTRPISVDVQYNDLTGNLVTTTLRGINATVFQHEMDHLNGITLDSKVTDPTKIRAMTPDLKYVENTDQLTNKENSKST